MVTDEDVAVLKSRLLTNLGISPATDPSMDDVLRIVATRAACQQYNEAKILTLPGPIHHISSQHAVVERPNQQPGMYYYVACY